MNEQQFRQCRLEKETEKGKLVHVAWISFEFARVGKRLSLKVGVRESVGSCVCVESGEWDDGWVVVEVYTK